MTAVAGAATDHRDARLVPTRVGSLSVTVRGVGQPMVLWHSLFVDERSWRRVEDRLAGEHRLVVITGPGHGSSLDPGRRYDLDECAEAAGDVLDALNVTEPVNWVGNAWGGHVGVCFAVRHPDRCRSLITFGTPIHAYSASGRLLTQVLLVAYRLFGPVPFIVNGVRDSLLSPRTRLRDPEAVAVVVDALRAMDRASLTNAVLSISLGRPDLTPMLSAVRCPALFVTGTDLTDWTPEQARAASERLPNGSSAVVADTAYLTPLEAPERTVELIRDFLALRAQAATSRTPPRASRGSP